MEHAICYISNASNDLDISDIEELLDFTVKNNVGLNIRGILLYSEGNFFQVLEGEKKVILKLWDKIQKDSRHNGIIQVIGQDFEKEILDSYRAEVLNGQQFGVQLPPEYVEPLKRMTPKHQRTIKRMMGNFIATSS